MKNLLRTLIPVTLAAFAVIQHAAAQGTAFTYQGELQNNGSPATGTYNMTFTLFNAASGGSSSAGPVTASGVAVSNGLFTVQIDFGSGVFAGSAYWLQIGVETNGASTFTALSPRQELTPTPYAIYAENATVLANGIAIGTGTGNSIVNNGAAYEFIGGGYYNIISNAEASTILGGYQNVILTNAYEATIAGGYTNLIGPNSEQAAIGGGYNNYAKGDGATVGGGYNNTANGAEATVGGGLGNQATGPAATVAGGQDNIAANNWSTISGGVSNYTTTTYATIGGGEFNTNYGDAGTIAGGQDNFITGFIYQPTIGGGYGNWVAGNYSTIGGGFVNTNYADIGTIAGGQNNIAGNVGDYPDGTIYDYQPTVGGGYGNQATNSYATVPGGFANVAGGQFSFAAGNSAQALHQGAFVWADSQSSTFSSTTNDQFIIRAEGGVAINTNSTGGASLFVQGGQKGGFGSPVVLFQNTNTSAGNGPALRVLNVGGTNAVGALCVSANVQPGVNSGLIASFGNANSFVTFITNDGTIYSKGLAVTSDRNAKEHFTALDRKAVLAKIVEMPVTEWNYKDDVEGKKHIGPVAQDFEAAFGLNGGDDRHISVVDEGGVALAAIQGLNQKVEEKEARIQAQESRIQNQASEISELKQELGQLKQLVNVLSQKFKEDEKVSNAGNGTPEKSQ